MTVMSWFGKYCHLSENVLFNKIGVKLTESTYLHMKSQIQAFHNNTRPEMTINDALRMRESGSSIIR